jgi:hypothetical protein
MLVAGLFLLPYNWIVCGTENVLFLLYPSPLAVTGSEGFLKMGRAMLFMLAKFFAVVTCAAVAAIPATLVYLATQSALASAVATWLTLLVCVFGIVWLVASAFERYDVNVVVSE